jgi:hypothetical protein
MPMLRCRYSWHAPGLALDAFRQASAGLALRPGQGLVGEVWAGAEARWIEDASSNPDLVRCNAARACALQSAYFFPVSFVGSDGRLLKPGVLEFFSKLQRQPDAQLPSLAESISAVIAQAVERMTQQHRIRVRAQTDDMTGLANRSHFHDQLERMCGDGAHGRPFGVLFVDLDQFKPINDAFGHEAGNVVLAEFARRLRALAPPGGRQPGTDRPGGGHGAGGGTPALRLPRALAHGVGQYRHQHLSPARHQPARPAACRRRRDVREQAQRPQHGQPLRG